MKKPRWKKRPTKTGCGKVWRSKYNGLRLTVHESIEGGVFYWEIGNEQYVTVQGKTLCAGLSRAYAEAAAGYRQHDYEYWHKRQVNSK